MKTTTRLLGGVALTLALTVGGAALAQEIDFGDDTSAWANDGQCDDPRFAGSGAATFSVAADALRDATDCRAAFEAGTVTLADSGATPVPTANDPQTAAGDIDFGADTGNWTNDGECDDGRFEGPGVGLTGPDTYRTDATDCRTLYTAGSITYIGEDSVAPSGNGANQSVGIVDGIDYGDNSSMFANDGQCDDPRFRGVGVWSGANANHSFADANDCLAAVQAGEATYIGEGSPSTPIGIVNGVDYGDDSSTWANDGQCDDPRFTGPNVWTGANENGIRADASDCLAAVQAGTATYAGDTSSNQYVGTVNGVDYGDNSSMFANDGQCDDPRFRGVGVWGGANQTHSRADANDCLAAVQAGEAIYVGENGSGDTSSNQYVGTVNGVDYGDNSSSYPNDGQCDDPRFTGPNVWPYSGEDGIRADANDCLAAVQAGTATYVGENGSGNANVPGGDVAINFGNDSGVWANDGECDDARFEGRGMGIQSQEHIMADATDCRAAYNAGTISLVSSGGGSGGEPLINFGNDSSTSANDGICDDPRFQGPGGASLLYAANTMADATDCRAAYNAGTVTFAP